MDVVAQYHQENISDKTHHNYLFFFKPKDNLSDSREFKQIQKLSNPPDGHITEENKGSAQSGLICGKVFITVWISILERCVESEE